MRYSREDDILLAKYFFDKPEGTSDKVFQAFGRMVNGAHLCCVRYTNEIDLCSPQYPHHPWKGWQEHHRIHKAKIDHFIQLIANGESLEEPDGS